MIILKNTDGRNRYKAEIISSILSTNKRTNRKNKSNARTVFEILCEWEINKLDLAINNSRTSYK